MSQRTIGGLVGIPIHMIRRSRQGEGEKGLDTYFLYNWKDGRASKERICFGLANLFPWISMDFDFHGFPLWISYIGFRRQSEKEGNAGLYRVMVRALTI